jgi:hypothetical protein
MHSFLKLVVPKYQKSGKESKKSLNSLIILVAWEIWKHRNACVFEGGVPCTQRVQSVVIEEGSVWCLAGASALQDLLLCQLPRGP